MTNDPYNSAYVTGILEGIVLGCGIGLILAFFNELLPSPMPWVARRYWTVSDWQRRRAMTFAHALLFVSEAGGNEARAHLLAERRFGRGVFDADRRWTVAAIPCAVAEFQRVAANRELGLPEDTP